MIMKKNPIFFSVVSRILLGNSAFLLIGWFGCSQNFFSFPFSSVRFPGFTGPNHVWHLRHFQIPNHFQLSSHNHHVVPPVGISLTLSRHFSLSFIVSGGSSGLHSLSSHRCCMYFRAGRPAFARPYVGVHRSTSLMSSSLLLQQCPACLVRLPWIVFVMAGRWPYSWCFVRCCLQDLFNIARSSSLVISNYKSIFFYFLFFLLCGLLDW